MVINIFSDISDFRFKLNSPVYAISTWTLGATVEMEMTAVPAASVSASLGDTISELNISVGNDRCLRTNNRPKSFFKSITTILTYH